MEYSISTAEIEEMKQYLREHPIDPAWDWEYMKLDNNHTPDEQKIARGYKEILQMLGEMEKDPPKKNPYPPEEVARMKQYIQDHPIHPEWDEAAENWLEWDETVPIEELIARSYRWVLQDIGEWEE